ncbi:hypothetical protein LXA43DRAFT_907603, partial [Ganoderma leucocontextum]
TLPLELLFRIFKETMVPPYQFDPSITSGALNPWLSEIRNRKALPLICRASFWPGMDVLYSDVVLRRMGQIGALAQTLRSRDVGTTLANMVKVIRVDSCPIWASCADAIQEDLAFILSSATSLRDFSYHPHHQFPILPGFPEGADLEDLFNPTWFIRCSPKLTRPILEVPIASHLQILNLAISLDHDTLRDIHHLLSGATLLRSLTLDGPVYGFRSSAELLQLPPLALPSLTELQFYFGTEREYDHYITTHWELPRLAYLTVFLREDVEIGALLERYGSHVIYLHLFPIARAIDHQHAAWDPCPSLARTCPHIEHLILPMGQRDTHYRRTWRTITIHSQTLKYLDFWWELEAGCIGLNTLNDTSGRGLPSKPQIVDARSTAPSLTMIRLLATSPEHRWWDTWVRSPTRNPDWPRVCSPDLIPPGSTKVLYHRFAKGWVAQTAGALLPQENSYCDTGRDLYAENWPCAYTREELHEGPLDWTITTGTDHGEIESEDDTYKPSDSGSDTSTDSETSVNGESTDGEDLSEDGLGVLRTSR